MAHQPQDETKQPPPPPSTETTSALATTSDMYLSIHLIVPYFITVGGEIRRPEHLIAWWSRIGGHAFSLSTSLTIKITSTSASSPPPLWTTFLHPNYPTLNELIDKLNRVDHTVDPKKAPKIVFVMEVAFRSNINSRVNIHYNENDRCWTK
jgi:hypothetical protein